MFAPTSLLDIGFPLGSTIRIRVVVVGTTTSKYESWLYVKDCPPEMKKPRELAFEKSDEPENAQAAVAPAVAVNLKYPFESAGFPPPPKNGVGGLPATPAARPSSVVIRPAK